MHIRQRYVKEVLLKRAKMFPVLGVLGPRQVGKSTFLMQQWVQHLSAIYITFDEKEVVMRAKQAPAQLLLGETNELKQHLIIDEAHKVPHIFDSVKAVIDRNRRMGAFTLSGSVEFSAKSGVRESLAGRMGLTYLYPMTPREIMKKNFIAPWLDLKFSEQTALPAKAIETWLERGGMPIFCNLGDIDERFGVINSWLDAVCYRDLKQLKDAKYDSEIAYNLMLYLATESLTSLNQLSAKLGTTPTVIKKHLSALEALFLIYKIPAFGNPKAQPKYQIFDAGVINALRGGKITVVSRHACLLTLVLNEIYSQYEYSGKLRPKLYYYRTRGGASVDLVLETREKLIAIDCMVADDISPYKQRGMRSFLNKHQQAAGYFVAPVQKAYNIDKNIHVIPWSCI